MKQIKFIIFIAFLFPIVLFGKNDSLVAIEQKVELIENNSTLDSQIFETEIISKELKQSSDGGFELIVYTDSTGIRKIVFSTGMSYGMLITKIYFENDTPIMIVDIEENFPVKKDQSGLDHEQLVEVYRISYYIFKWEPLDSIVIFLGKRVHSKKHVFASEYNYIIDLTRKLLRKN